MITGSIAWVALPYIRAGVSLAQATEPLGASYSGACATSRGFFRVLSRRSVTFCPGVLFALIQKKNRLCGVSSNAIDATVLPPFRSRRYTLSGQEQPSVAGNLRDRPALHVVSERFARFLFGPVCGEG